MSCPSLTHDSTLSTKLGWLTIWMLASLDRKLSWCLVFRCIYFSSPLYSFFFVFFLLFSFSSLLFSFYPPPSFPLCSFLFSIFPLGFFLGGGGILPLPPLATLTMVAAGNNPVARVIDFAYHNYISSNTKRSATCVIRTGVWVVVGEGGIVPHPPPKL